MTLDLTQVIVALVNGGFGVAVIVIGAVINKRMKDQQAAVVVNNAIKNALGAGQQAVDGMVEKNHPQFAVPWSFLTTDQKLPAEAREMLKWKAASVAPPVMGVMVQYVLDHAGSEANRLGITPAKIADKVNAQIGLASIATNGAGAITAAAAPAVIKA